MSAIYRVRSGEMDETFSAPDTATPSELAEIALIRTNAQLLGLIIGVEGGRFVGDDEMYLHTETFLRERGMWVEGDAK